MMTGSEEWTSCAELLRALRSKGVEIWAEGGQVCFRAPKGAVDNEDVQRIQASKLAIMQLLEERVDFDQRGATCYPLAYSQLARWRSYAAGVRRAMRQIAFAIHWRGALDICAFRDSVSELFSRHDALRTNILVSASRPMQRVDASGRCSFSACNLSAAPGNREREVLDGIEAVVTSPLDITADPLFAVRVLTVSENEYVLVIAMEHMIGDMASLRIVERELLSGYGQLLASGRIDLPTPPMQFGDYSLRLRDKEATWRREHMPYWSEHLAGWGSVRFPRDAITAPAGGSSGWATLPFRLDRELRHRLQQLCKTIGSTLPLCMLTAYSALVLRWCRAHDMVVQYQTDGRIDPRVESTIGFFASALYLRASITSNSTFRDLLSLITEDYCRAHEHADLSLLAAEEPTPGYTKATSFNWVPLAPASDIAALGREGESVDVSHVPLAHLAYPHMQLDHEPGILFYDDGSQVAGALHFPIRYFADATMRRFLRNVKAFSLAMLRDMDATIAAAALVP